jgi:hypothetical protein
MTRRLAPRWTTRLVAGALAAGACLMATLPATAAPPTTANGVFVVEVRVIRNATAYAEPTLSSERTGTINAGTTAYLWRNFEVADNMLWQQLRDADGKSLGWVAVSDYQVVSVTRPTPAEGWPPAIGID